MARNYIDEKTALIKKNGICTVELSVGENESITLTPKRLFPISDLYHYIALVDGQNKEYGIIKDLNLLDDVSKNVILQCLDEYYMMPKIEQILGWRDRYGTLKFKVLTDRGVVTFDIKNRHYDIKKSGNRIIMRDRNDNRYEIVDYTKLDKKSLKYLIQYI